MKKKREMQRFYAYLAFALCALCPLWLSILQAAERPNIVFIVTDDQRWDCMSCAGHPFLKTPNMDRIAREGAYFENMYFNRMKKFYEQGELKAYLEADPCKRRRTRANGSH